MRWVRDTKYLDMHLKVRIHCGCFTILRSSWWQFGYKHIHIQFFFPFSLFQADWQESARAWYCGSVVFFEFQMSTLHWTGQKPLSSHLLSGLSFIILESTLSWSLASTWDGIDAADGASVAGVAAADAVAGVGYAGHAAEAAAVVRHTLAAVAVAAGMQHELAEHAAVDAGAVDVADAAAVVEGEDVFAAATAEAEWAAGRWKPSSLRPVLGFDSGTLAQDAAYKA